MVDVEPDDIPQSAHCRSVPTQASQGQALQIATLDAISAI
jgi:hypothetical protein